MDDNTASGTSMHLTASTAKEQDVMKAYREKAKKRQALESIACSGQEQQAKDVNRHRSWEGGEHLPKDPICVLKLGTDKNKLGIKDLPVQITGLIYFKQSDQLKYKLCSKDGILKGTYGRGELTPLPHLTAELMGINYNQLDKQTTLTPNQAHDRYLQIGGKNSSCRCQTTCSLSKSCKCRKLNKLCTRHCHKGKENLLCQLCVRNDYMSNICSAVDEMS